jgi:hypothetical protein
MKGKQHSEDTKKKISLKNKNLGKGRIVSQETREKISISDRGRIPWNKGKHMSEESRRKMSIAKIGKPSNRRRKKNNLVAGY